MTLQTTSGCELLFQGDSKESIINYGTIEALDGNVTLIGRLIETPGTLIARKGAVSVGAASEVLLKLEDHPLLTIRPSLEGDGQITHTGKIEALVTQLQADGKVYEFGINLEGTITALNTVEQNGRIYLKADSIAISPQAKLEASSTEIESSGILYQEGTILSDQLTLFTLSGPFYNQGTLQGTAITIDAFKFLNAGAITAPHIQIHTQDAYIETAQGHLLGKQISLQSETTLFSSGTATCPGGKISISSPHLILASSTLNTSSAGSGGEIFIGSPNTQITHLTGNTQLLANATESGNGGTIAIWSEEKTICYGSFQANAGPKGGNGGFIEISSHGDVFSGATTQVAAPQGKPGQVLLDPKNVVINAVTGIYPQYEFIDPNFGGGTNFGARGLALSSGHIVITKPNDNFAAPNAGAVYMYNGVTAALLSTLTGSTANDLVGTTGLLALTNGNYVIRSASWNNGAATTAGAVTWGSGVSGVTGIVSATNSLIGSTTSDQVGSGGVTSLTNGNYVVRSPNWDNGATTNAGAVTWGNGLGGTVGAVSIANSLVGTTSNDQVGSTGTTALTNGNYVVRSSLWDNGAATNAGAVTWGNGLGGTVGAVSASNSLVGTTTNDNVGSGNIAPLTNGNYVTPSSDWDNGATVNVGAVTWGNGLGGTVGAVSASNSLVGTTANDHVGGSVLGSLVNGNYFIASPLWNNGAATAAGAVTWGNGLGGTVGAVSASNSLVGTTTNDQLGNNNVQALTNGNYVVGSPLWDNGATANVGAATWGNGLGGTVGAVSVANSLVGTTANDNVGSLGTIALTNGNYVVFSPSWDNGAATDAGAATWGNGTGGTVGAVSATNSLVGGSTNSQVGLDRAAALTNGNYVVVSSSWSNGAATGAGAVTWGNGTGGTVGSVSIANSLVGTTTSDHIGVNSVIPLTNGNYVVKSSLWHNGAVPDAGAATWGNGLGGTVGAVSAANSLVGSATGDAIGSGATALTNGNYVTGSPTWRNGAATNAGAVALGNGLGGTVGVVSAANSLVGTTTNDQVGLLVSLLSNGDYVVASPLWDNGATTNAGAITVGSPTTGISGPVTPQNSVVGQSASTGSGVVLDDVTSGTFVGLFPTEGSGKVRAGIFTPSQMTYDRAEAQTMTITPSFLTSTLNTGASVVIQANNDMTISSPITATPGAGSLTLSAGRSVQINANVTTGNANLTVTANAPLSSGVIDADRDVGNATLAIANGVTINTGSASLSLSLQDGAGKTNTGSGDLTLGDNVSLLSVASGAQTLTAQENNIVLGNNVLLQTVDGDILLTAGLDITAGANAATLQTLGTGQLILVTDSLFPTAPLFGTGSVNFPNATLATAGGKLLIYTSERSLNTQPAAINGVPYVPGPLAIDSTTEKWGVYYPSSSGIPFTIFYKTPVPPTPPPIPTPNPNTSRAFHAMITAVQDVFFIWQNPWWNDLFFTADPYPPYLTPKNLRLKLPSLVHDADSE